MSDIELIVWIVVFAAFFVACGVVMGYPLGRRAMLREIHGRRRIGVFRRARRRLERAEASATDILDAEVIR